METASPFVLAQSQSQQSSCQVVYMCEKDNDSHRKLIRTLQNSSDPALALVPRSSPRVMPLGYIEEPVTGKRILFSKRTPYILHSYMNSLETSATSNGFTRPCWHELIQLENGDSVCKLMLPDDIPLPDPLRRLSVRAPQGADGIDCSITLRELYEAGLLDDRFFSKPDEDDQKRAAVAIDEKDLKVANLSANTRCYPRKKASFWSRSLRDIPRPIDSILKVSEDPSTRLYPTIVSIHTPDDLSYAPMLVLTRLPLPRLSSFSVFAAAQKGTASLQTAVPFVVDDQRLDLLFQYTLRITRALQNKPVEGSLEKLLYFFAPLKPSFDLKSVPDTKSWRLPDVESHIAWNQVQEATERWATRLVPEDGELDEDASRDCVMQDRAVEFTNRHYVVKLRRDLSPLSRMQEGSVSTLVHFTDV